MDDQGDVLLGEPPAFTHEAASALAQESFGLIGACTPLGSERDQGFLVNADTGPLGVLKISNADKRAAILDMETRAALHVLAVDPALPVAPPLPLLGSDPVAYTTRISGPTGATHFVRASGFMPGRASIDANELDGDALFDHGVTIARLGRAMRSFFHASAGRTLLWDVRHASALRPMTDAIDDPTHRALVDAVLDRFESFVAPRWSQLRSQVIHGDVTLDNALVDEHGRISGIVDWGDMSHSALVCDLTSALESLLAGRDPGKVVPLALRFVDGYRSVTPLEPEELAVLPDLLTTRLVTVAVLFSWRAKRHPDNDYLRRWETTLWPLLTYLVDDGCERDTVLFVTSGSEANDAAWRLATVWTGAGGGLVTRYAYHGVTQAIADLSPEEWKGATRPAHVELFDPLHASRDGTTRVDAADDLLRASERLGERGHMPAVTFVDGAFTSDGILAPPAAYVRALADRTHEVGALYVADEVQVGHGRGGAHP